MSRSKIFSVIFLSTVFISSFSLNAETLSRRGINLVYDHQPINDGFGNLKSISVSGMVENTTDQDVSRITAGFELLWESRRPIEKKLKFRNVEAGESKEFQFEIELGTNPDILTRLIPKLSHIKFSKTRKASSPSQKDLSSTAQYELTRLNEEGKAFIKCIRRLIAKNPFNPPIKDEFETTDEYETRINYMENVHFSELMDRMEKTYGQLIGGRDAVVRYLPSVINKELVYVSENSAFFRVPVKFGRYNADLERYEDVNLVPRTFGYAPPMILPESDLELVHKAGLFFLRRPYFDIRRDEAKILRSNEKFILLEVAFRTGLIQEGPYPEAFCLVEEIQLKNIKSGKIYRKWSLQSE